MTSSRMGCHLSYGLSGGYEVRGFGQAAGADAVFGQLLLAGVIEPAGKLDILGKRVQVIVPAFG